MQLAPKIAVAPELDLAGTGTLGPGAAGLCGDCRLTTMRSSSDSLTRSSGSLTTLDIDEQRAARSSGTEFVGG